MADRADVPTSTPLDGWLAELGRPTGSPGGGSASGVMLAIAAALLRMVAEYTAEDARATECGERLAVLRSEALETAEADGVVSAEFGAALALPTDAAGRDAHVADAALGAARSAAGIGAVGARMLPEVRLLVEIGNPSLVADLAVAVEALGAGLSGTLINVRANLRTAQKHEAAAPDVEELQADVARLDGVRRAVARIGEEVFPGLDD
jgi:formiminotetrahydrofolate cyclodeaminase